LFTAHDQHLAYSYFNDTATSELYTLSLHDALPISPVAGAPTTSIISPRRNSSISTPRQATMCWPMTPPTRAATSRPRPGCSPSRSEEHTSELQSRFDLVCRLLLEKKKKKNKIKYCR